MSIISNDYDGSATYYFSQHDQSVILKKDVFYNYVGTDEAFALDFNFARFLIAGTIYSRATGLRCTYSSPTIDVASTGAIYGNFTAIRVEGFGLVEINNFGIVSGGWGIDGAQSAGYFTVNNYGLIAASQNGGYAVRTADNNDTIVNLGTLSGAVGLGGGDDRIDTHLGTLNGVIFGGAGDDTYVVTTGQVVSEAANGSEDDGGNDGVISYGDYTLPVFVETLTLSGSATQGRGNAGDNSIYGNDLGNRLFGGAGDDGLQGGSGDDVLRGGAGDDLLQSVEGADQFFGGAGNDVVYVGLDRVTVDGGAGLDVVAFLFNDTAITADLSTGVITGGAASQDVLTSIEGIWGSEYADTLTGDAAANDLLGFFGDDVLKGAGGDDVIEGYGGADMLDGGDGIDTLSFNYAVSGVTASLTTRVGTAGDAAGDTYANFENLRGGFGADTLTGNAGVNLIEGGAGNDTLIAGGGADTLYGDLGDDTLTGGVAIDVFGFRDVSPDARIPILSGFGHDTITDFQDKVDRVSFVGNSLVHSMSDLTIAQVGANTVVTVTDTGDSITLLNFSAIKFTSADVIFGPEIVIG